MKEEWGTRSQVGSEAAMLKQIAVALRREAMPAEALVWEMLRGRRFQGLKFRRQHVLEGHIVDFYCHEAKLCLELDGAPHLEAAQWDKDVERDDFLRSKGYKVIRFMNDVVTKNPAAFRLALQQASLP